MAIRSSILAWEIPWTEEPGGLQSMGLQKNWTQLSNQTTTTSTIHISIYLNLLSPLQMQYFGALSPSELWEKSHKNNIYFVTSKNKI